MNRKLIGAFILLLLLLGGALAICLPLRKKQTVPEITLPKSTLLINDLHDKNFLMQLFYGDISNETIHTFDVTSHSLQFDDKDYISYDNGFIEADTYESLLKAVNDYRSQAGLEMAASIGHCFELTDSCIVSLTQEPDVLYKVDMLTNDVNACAINSEEGSGALQHVILGRDAYYALALRTDGRTANWYALSLDDFSLQDSKVIPLAAPLTKSVQCALDDEGTAYFTTDHELLLVTKDETLHLALSFSPNRVYFQDNKLYALSLTEFFLSYAVFDDSLEILASGQANLPNKKVTLSSCTLRDDHLYTICQDNSHPLYRYYLTIYDINNHEMDYCLAIKNVSDYALIGGQLENDKKE